MESSLAGVGRARRPSSTILRQQRSCLCPEQWPSQAGWAASAVDAQRGTGEGSNIESRRAQLLICLCIFFQGEQTLLPQRQYVAGQRLPLGIVDLDVRRQSRDVEISVVDREGPVRVIVTK